MTVRLRLALNYLAAIALTVGLVAVLVWWQFGAALRASLDETLQTRAVSVATSLENNGQSGLQEGNASGPPGVFVAIFDSGGALVDATSGAPSGLALPASLTGARDVSLRGTTYAVYAVASQGGGTVVAGSSLASIDATVARLTQSLIAVGALTALGSLGGGWWLAKRALRPVALITAEARQIGAVDIERRLPVPRHHDELWALATTLNEMLERVSQAVQRQRAFVDVGHLDVEGQAHRLHPLLAAGRGGGQDRPKVLAAFVHARPFRGSTRPTRVPRARKASRPRCTQGLRAGVRIGRQRRVKT